MGVEHQPGIRVSNRWVWNDIAATQTADIVQVRTVMIFRQRRNVQSADPELAENFHGLILQLWRVVDNEFFGNAIIHDGIHRLTQ